MGTLAFSSLNFAKTSNERFFVFLFLHSVIVEKRSLLLPWWFSIINVNFFNRYLRLGRGAASSFSMIAGEITRVDPVFGLGE